MTELDEDDLFPPEAFGIEQITEQVVIEAG